MPCILGIDTGGTMAKAAVFDLDGTERASARQANAVRFPEPGHTEVDPESMWRSACGAALQALKASGVSPGDVVGISTTGHGNGLYAVDADGLPVGPGIVSTDSRADAVGRDWTAAGHAPAAEAAIMQ
ncbi:FGGY family carbohydrate kinase, partial [Lichenihabitans sp. Uapishka_5]|uniref:FGGY family carbohydrate kinase n=1 Tax=Lichenihabitans sp. Uapishka_5 TaxID=3037302 RepID=UPI0029E80CAE